MPRMSTHPQAQELLERLLKELPAERLTLKDVLKVEWCTQDYFSDM